MDLESATPFYGSGREKKVGVGTHPKLLAQLRDAYIYMLLGLAGNVCCLNGRTFRRKRIPETKGGPRVCNAKDSEDKVILEMSRRLSC